jgi:hypothetical protein
MTRLLWMFVAIGIAACSSGGGSDKPSAPSGPTTPSGPAAVATVTVSAAANQLAFGRTLQLAATLRDAAGATLSGRTVNWQSSSETQATVSATGLASALVGAGAVTITATSEGQSGTLSLALVAPSPLVAIGSWTSIGPSNFDSHAGRLGAGKLQALAIFPGNTSIMYAGGGLGSGNQGPISQAGMLKTVNGGTTWTPVNAGITEGMVNAVWVDATNADIALAGTEHDGIFRTTNGGATWARVGAFGATSEIITANGAVFAATETGIRRSADAGATWTVVQATTSTVRAMATGGGAIIAGLQNGTVMMQASPTAAWQTVSTNPGRNVHSVAIDPNNPAVAYALLSCTPCTLLSAANGWTEVPLTITAVHALLVAPWSPLLWMGTGNVAYSSANGGISFTQLASGWDVRKIYSVPGQSAVIYSTDQGLFRTANGGATWSVLAASSSATMLSSVAVRGSVILTGVQDFSAIVSYDGGTGWIEGALSSGAVGPGGEDGQVLINPGNASYCYGYTLGGYQVSSDGCRIFRYQTAAGVLRGDTYPTQGANSIVDVDPAVPSRVYAVAENGIYRSTDFGVTMAPTNWPIANPVAIGVAPGSQTILVGTTAGLSRSVNGGATWTNVSLPGVSGFPTVIAVHPNVPQIVMVGLSRGPGRGGGVLRSVDGGNTFTVMNAGLTTAVAAPSFGSDITAMRFSPTGDLALSMATGIYVSADLGNNWQNARANAVPARFSDISWDGGFLYAASYGQGVLRAIVSSGASARASGPGFRRQTPAR